jgi:hypothetical protein
LLAAVVLASSSLGCDSVHDATSLGCPDGQYASAGQCVCDSSDAPPVDGSCPPIDRECELSDCVDDANPCTEPTCLAGSDSCSNEPVADDTTCELGSAVGVCAQGECTPAPWELGTAFKIADADEEISTPLVAVAADGSAMALWSEGNDVVGSAFDPTMGWKAPVVVEPEHVPERGIALGMDAAGNAVALYARLQQGAIELVAEGYSAERGAWDSFAIISEEAAVTDAPQIAVTQGGDAVAVWWQAPNDIVIARGSSDSMSWEPSQPVSLDDGLDKKEPFVSLDGDGEGALVYRAADPAAGPGAESVWVAIIEADQVSAPTQVSNGAEWVRDARIAAGASSDLMAIWEEVNDLVYARFVNEAWGSPALVEEASGGIASPTISVDGDGDFQVAWLQDGDARTRRFVSSGAVWDDVRVLLVSTSEDARPPSLAAPPNGEARVSWAQDQHVRLSVFEGDSGWGPFLKVSPDLEPPALDVQGPRVGVATDGTEVVVWADGPEIWTWADRPD